jgi:hypothetical protein
MISASLLILTCFRALPEEAIHAHANGRDRDARAERSHRMRPYSKPRGVVPILVMHPESSRYISISMLQKITILRHSVS